MNYHELILFSFKTNSKTLLLTPQIHILDIRRDIFTAMGSSADLATLGLTGLTLTRGLAGSIKKSQVTNMYRAARPFVQQFWHQGKDSSIYDVMGWMLRFL